MSESDLLGWNEANDYEDDGQSQEYYPAGTACALIHEHDPATCAGASAAELLLDSVRAQLVDLAGRVEGTLMDEEADRQWALEQVHGRLHLLLPLLNVYDFDAISGGEDGCAACGAHWSYSPWASAADRSGRRHQHAAECRERGELEP